MCKILQDRMWQWERRFEPNRVRLLFLSRGWPRWPIHEGSHPSKRLGTIKERESLESLLKEKVIGISLLLMNILQSPRRGKTPHHHDSMHTHKYTQALSKVDPLAYTFNHYYMTLLTSEFSAHTILPSLQRRRIQAIRSNKYVASYLASLMLEHL
jgi:hypothetical protein